MPHDSTKPTEPMHIPSSAKRARRQSDMEAIPPGEQGDGLETKTHFLKDQTSPVRSNVGYFICSPNRTSFATWFDLLVHWEFRSMLFCQRWKTSFSAFHDYNILRSLLYTPVMLQIIHKVVKGTLSDYRFHSSGSSHD